MNSPLSGGASGGVNTVAAHYGKSHVMHHPSAATGSMEVAGYGRRLYSVLTTSLRNVSMECDLWKDASKKNPLKHDPVGQGSRARLTQPLSARCCHGASPSGPVWNTRKTRHDSIAPSAACAQLVEYVPPAGTNHANRRRRLGGFFAADCAVGVRKNKRKDAGDCGIVSSSRNAPSRGTKRPGT